MDETENFKEHLSGVFSRSSTSYDHIGPRFFSYFGKKLVEFGGLKKGSKILDVACGRGAILFPASEAVTESGEVIGIDISRQMVQQTRNEIVKQGITNAQVLEMDAENLEFPESSFDFVICSLGLFFLPDLERALTGFYRVLKPGGYFLASTFKKRNEKDDLSRKRDKLNESFKDRLKPIPEAKTISMNTASEIKGELSKSGFGNLEITAKRKTFYFRNEDEYWQAAWSHGVRGFFERMGDDVLAKYKKQVIELILDEVTEKGIPDRWDLLFTRAQKQK